MPLNARELALRLAKHLGVISLDPLDPSNVSPSGRGLQPGDVEELAACINAALQEVWDLAPTGVRTKRYATVLTAPTAVTLDLTHGNRAVGAFGGYAAWMAGCTVRIGGEWNEVVDEETLVSPWLGADGTGLAATVYGDCVTLEAGAVSLLKPVKAGGAVLREGGAGVLHPGAPERYRVEAPGEPATPRLRVWPLPERETPVSFWARLNAPAVSAAELQSLDPLPPLPVPGGWAESVLLPFALQRLSLHPDFASPNLKTELPRQLAAARRIVLGAGPARSPARAVTAFR